MKNDLKLIISVFMILIFSNSFGEEQKLRVAVPENNPLAYRDYTGKYTGAYIEILNEICKKENVTPLYYHGSIESCIYGLEKGKIDCIVAIPKEFSSKYISTKEEGLTDWSIFYSLKKKNIVSIFDFENKNIGYINNDFFAEKMMENFKKYKIIANYKVYDTSKDAVQDIKNKKISFIVSDRLRFLENDEFLDLIKVGNEYNPYEITFLAGNAKSKKIIFKADEYLIKIKTDPNSYYAKIMTKIDEGEKQINRDRREVSRIAVVFLVVVLFFACMLFHILTIRKYFKAKKATAECDVKNHKLEDKFYTFIDFYQKVIDAIPEPVYYTNTEGMCIGINSAFIKMYDKKREEIIGKKIHEIFDIEDPVFADNQMKILKEGGIRNYEVSNFNTTSGKFSLKVHEETIYNMNGEIEGISGFLEDITDYKSKSNDYDRVSKEMDTYLDMFEDVFVAVNNDGEVIYANKSAAELFEYTKEEIKGKNWFDNFMPGFIGGSMKNAFAVMRDPDMEPEDYFEIPVLTKSGAEKRVGWRNHLIREGKNITLISCGKDITERNVADKAITDAKNFLKAVLDVIPYSISILDETGKIIVVNKEWRSFSHDIMYKNFGVGVNFIERLEGNEDPYFTSAQDIAFGIREIINKKKSKFLIEYDYDGKAKIRVKGIGFESDGKARIVIIQEDITERKKLF